MVFVKKKRGFTLIELLVVITIIGVLAVLPLNVFREAYDRAQLRVAAERILSILQEAKANAQAHSDACYGVRVNSSTSITIVKGGVTDGACDQALEQSTEEFYHNLTISITPSTVTEVLFMPPHGMVYNAATLIDPVTFDLMTVGGIPAQITLSPSLSTFSLTTIPS